MRREAGSTPVKNVSGKTNDADWLVRESHRRNPAAGAIKENGDAINGANGRGKIKSFNGARE